MIMIESEGITEGDRFWRNAALSHDKIMHAFTRPSFIYQHPLMALLGCHQVRSC
jgi:hypothetical protein